MLAGAASQMKRYGFRALKVKCGIDGKKDVRILRALRKLTVFRGLLHEICD